MRSVARIAQSVEQGIENPRVLGSIPSPGTKFILTDLHGGPFLHSKPAKNKTSSRPFIHDIPTTASAAHTI